MISWIKDSLWNCPIHVSKLAGHYCIILIYVFVFESWCVTLWRFLENAKLLLKFAMLIVIVQVILNFPPFLHCSHSFFRSWENWWSRYRVVDRSILTLNRRRANAENARSFDGGWTPVLAHVKGNLSFAACRYRAGILDEKKVDQQVSSSLCSAKVLRSVS